MGVLKNIVDAIKISFALLLVIFFLNSAGINVFTGTLLPIGIFLLFMSALMDTSVCRL